MHAELDADLIHILLVEDNLGDTLLIKEAFQELGEACRLTTVNDGEKALAMLKEKANEPIAQPDLILLDLNLPKLNGHEVLKQLKANERLRRIPVVVLTSSRADRDVTTAYDLHCNAYFCKPSSYAEYVQVARVVAGFWQKALTNQRTQWRK